MTGTIRSEVPLDHTPEDVWHLLLRCLRVSDAREDGSATGTELVLVPQTDAMDAVDSEEPLRVTLDHDARSTHVDLSHLPDVPAGLRASTVLDARPAGSVLGIEVTTEAWWGGAAEKVARIGWLRSRVSGDLEERLRTVVREVVDLGMDADDEELRELLEHGTPTTQRLAEERRARLEGT